MLLAVLWGVVPTPHWLHTHSWQVPGNCAVCDEPDDLEHLLCGCIFGASPYSLGKARAEWKKALGAGGAVEPRPLVDADSFSVKEFVNGFRVAAGTVRFEEGQPVSSDGSAKFAGYRFAVCSGSVVQVGSDGVHRAVCFAATPDCLQSAVVGEMLGVDALAMVLGRGTLANQEPHAHGSLEVGIDCSAVVGAVRRFCREQAPGRFPFAGSFRDAALGAVRACNKVRAHVWEGDARSEGWHAEWVGNDLADHYAKLARLALDADPEPWIQEQRSRHRLLRDLLGGFAGDSLWADMRRLRPAAGRARALRERPAGNEGISRPSLATLGCAGPAAQRSGATERPCGTRVARGLCRRLWQHIRRTLCSPLFWRFWGPGTVGPVRQMRRPWHDEGGEARSSVPRRRRPCGAAERSLPEAGRPGGQEPASQPERSQAGEIAAALSSCTCSLGAGARHCSRGHGSRPRQGRGPCPLQHCCA